MITYEAGEATKAEQKAVYGAEVKRKLAEGKVEVKKLMPAPLNEGRIVDFITDVMPQVEFALVNDPGGDNAACEDLGVATVDLCEVTW